jgi:hypothetical protein
MNSTLHLGRETRGEGNQMREGNCPMREGNDATCDRRSEKTAHESSINDFIAECFGPSSLADPSYQEIRRYRGRIDEWISIQSRKFCAT